MSFYNLGLRSRFRKLAPSNVRQTIRALNDDSIILDWVNRGDAIDNWGDAIAPIIVESISGKKVVPYRNIVNLRTKPVYTTIGSMLGTISAKEVIVWGTGFVHSQAKVRAKTLRISAVRGPLTREKLLQSGFKCPETYGDPALLFPSIYTSQARPTFELGIIPHFKEKNLPILQKFRQDRRVKIIDIEAGTTEVIDQIHQCEMIASGSLHGLVAADAYGIPANWIKLSDRPAGDGFKFLDYLKSTQSGRELPLNIDSDSTYKDIVGHIGRPEFNLDLERFRSSSPFTE